MSLRSQRGSALVLSVLVVLVIAVIGVAVIRFASREVAGATASRKTQALVACADAGRQVIVSRFKALGISPVSLTALNLPMDANTRVVGGHYDTSDVQVAQVSYLPEASFGPDRGVVQDISNRVIGTGGGGKPMKVVVHCQQGGVGNDPATGRQLEVEFGLRFGI
jgi:type II secretory pathway pseudopilin PulG